jgi:hypothetical protein
MNMTSGIQTKGGWEANPPAVPAPESKTSFDPRRKKKAGGCFSA